MSKEDKITKGKTRLNKLIKSGKELTVFSIPNEDIKRFSMEAKRYGVLYCVVKSKTKDGSIDIISRAEDAPKINRIVERFRLAAVNAGSITKDNGEFQNRSHAVSGADKLIDEVLSKDPRFAGTEKTSPSGRNFEKMGQEEKGIFFKRRSVREKLEHYRDAEDGNRSILERILLKGKSEKER